MLTILLLLSLPAQADVYRWVDENGNVHFGDKPVENSELVEIVVKENQSTGDSKGQRAERRRNLIQAFEEDRLAKKEKQEEKRIKKDKHNRKCAWVRDNLKQSKAARSLYNLDKDDKRITLTDAQREQEMKKMRDDLKRYCN